MLCLFRPICQFIFMMFKIHLSVLSINSRPWPILEYYPACPNTYMSIKVVATYDVVQPLDVNDGTQLPTDLLTF